VVLVFSLSDAITQDCPSFTGGIDGSIAQFSPIGCFYPSGIAGGTVSTIAPTGLERVFFANSGTETVEAAIKFSRYATGRSQIVYCQGGYHGLTMGSLSATGDPHYRQGFGPFLADFKEIPFGDLAALEKALINQDVAAFITEPIQGHGVRIPEPNYLPAAALCRRYGTLFVADEVQTGLGRTGKIWAVEHWGVEPDILCVAKALSGGFVPVGAVLCRRWLFDRVFDRMDRSVVHGSTFGKNNLACRRIATLQVIEEEKLVERSAVIGQQIIAELQPLVDQYECLQEVRGLGMMIALEFAEPSSWSLKAAWKMLETANKGLFSQLIVVPLFTRHQILSQVSGHGMNIIKFIPPSPSPMRIAVGLSPPLKMWSLMLTAYLELLREFGKTLASQAIRQKTAKK
jgi:ornithine--oxo-acid transaminase